MKVCEEFYINGEWGITRVQKSLEVKLLDK